MEVIYHYPVFGSMFHDHPNEFMDLLKDIFIKAYRKAIDSMHEDKVLFSSQSLDTLKLKNRLDIKLNNVPPSREIAPE